jgi:hypothetical protein
LTRLLLVDNAGYCAQYPTVKNIFAPDLQQQYFGSFDHGTQHVVEFEAKRRDEEDRGLPAFSASGGPFLFHVAPAHVAFTWWNTYSHNVRVPTLWRLFSRLQVLLRLRSSVVVMGGQRDHEESEDRVCMLKHIEEFID